MDKTTAADALGVNPTSIERLAVNWTAPAGTPVRPLGPGCNITKWYYTVHFTDGRAAPLLQEPTAEEIDAYIRENFPQEYRLARR